MTTIWTGNFASDWQTHWNVGNSWGMQNATPIADPTYGTAMRVVYPAKSCSPEATREYGLPVGGCQWYANPFPNADEYWLKYALKFESGFQWVKGGKLPGLYGGIDVSGGNVPDGTNGFSTRHMWRTAGAGEVYAYIPSTTADYGVSLGRGDWHFTVGKWTTIEQHIKLNTPGVSNGIVMVWFNAVKVLSLSNILFRTVPTLQINGILFSTFFGGHDPSWETPTTVHVDFANFVIATSYIS